MDPTLFQYCQKIVLFNQACDAVLLAKRKGEADFDGVFSFVGGKMESSDKDFVEGLRREKNEEIGEDAKIEIYPEVSVNEYYIKNSGQAMVLPHHFAVYKSGDVVINDEYSECAWVRINELASFQPKIDTVQPMVEKMLKLRDAITQEDATMI